MTKYVTATDQRWEATEVRGVAMQKCPLWSGKHQVRSTLYRMRKGTQLASHYHGSWVQVFIISGQMQVEAVGSEAHTIAAGGYYFVEPGETHVETALEETQLLVVAHEG